MLQIIVGSMCSIVVLTLNQFLINCKPLYCPCELVSFMLVSVYLSLKSCSLVVRGGPGEAKGQLLLSCQELGICGGECRGQNLTFLRNKHLDTYHILLLCTAVYRWEESLIS